MMRLTTNCWTWSLTNVRTSTFYQSYSVWANLWLVARDELVEGAVPLWSYHWAFDAWRFCCDGSCTISVCVSSELLEDEREGRRPMAWYFFVWYRTNYCIEDIRTPSLRRKVLGSDTTGPAVASRYKFKAHPVPNTRYLESTIAPPFLAAGTLYLAQSHFELELFWEMRQYTKT